MKYISIQIQIMENLEIFIKILIYEIQTSSLTSLKNLLNIW